MKYSLTEELKTGHDIIDGQHKELFGIINNLFDACAQGQGRDKIAETAKFLEQYVEKHFFDEEKLQLATKYPEYAKHKQFHQSYRIKLKECLNALNKNGASVAALSEVNTAIAALVSHIKGEDKKMAAHVRAVK